MKTVLQILNMKMKHFYKFDRQSFDWTLEQTLTSDC